MLSLTSIWTILPGNKTKVIGALKELAATVQATEPGTLVYIPQAIDLDGYSNPKPNSNDIVFVEMYANQEALDYHIYGPNGKSDPSGTFVDFVAKYGKLFVWDDQADMPKMVVTALNPVAGFVREPMEFPE